MHLSCYWQWISSKHCQNSLRIHSAVASWIHSYFDNVMTRFMINNRTDEWKTDVNLLKSQREIQNRFSTYADKPWTWQNSIIPALFINLLSKKWILHQTNLFLSPFAQGPINTENMNEIEFLAVSEILMFISHIYWHWLLKPSKQLNLECPKLINFCLLKRCLCCAVWNQSAVSRFYWSEPKRKELPNVPMEENKECIYLFP